MTLSDANVPTSLRCRLRKIAYQSDAIGPATIEDLSAGSRSASPWLVGAAQDRALQSEIDAAEEAQTAERFARGHDLLLDTEKHLQRIVAATRERRKQNIVADRYFTRVHPPADHQHYSDADHGRNALAHRELVHQPPHFYETR